MVFHGEKYCFRLQGFTIGAALLSLASAQLDIIPYPK